MKILNNVIKDTFVVPLEQDIFLEKLSYAADVLKKQMNTLKSFVENKENISTLEMSRFVENEISKSKCSPTFKNYKGFPEAVCISVNKQLVHGIPSDYKLNDGDIITFDFGITFEDAMVDSARTFSVGNTKYEKLIKTTEQCLLNAINAIEIGKRLGSIGYSVHKTAQKEGFKVIQQYGGHGISRNKIHDHPFVSNKSLPSEGVRFQAGMLFAIEPLLVPETVSDKTTIDTDKWTVYTEDVGAHFEDTIFINQNGKVINLTR